MLCQPSAIFDGQDYATAISALHNSEGTASLRYSQQDEIMVLAPNQLPLIDQDDYHLLQQLREREPSQSRSQVRLTLGQRLSDVVVAIVGSWRFIIIQSGILAIWIVLNVIAFVQHWDPYPFILLNLVLSFQAAYTAPIIMMSQNRQAEVDRQNARHDYEVNMKAELEIELLHDKFNRLERICTQAFDTIKASQQKQLDRLAALITKQAGIFLRSGFADENDLHS